MPQIELEETDHERIIRLHKKNGWYSGNGMASAELPGYLQCPGENRTRYSDFG